ncbi:MAG: RNA polymerase sigma factor [bacterium]|nr:RNA polymerase sigma factor [bacterium]
MNRKNDEAFRELYNRYKNPIFSYIKRYLYYSSDDIISDLTNDVFIRAYMNLPHLKKVKYFKSWLYRIAHNLCIDYIRTKKAVHLDMDHLPDNTVDKRVDLENDYVENEKIETMLNIIDNFDYEIKALIILKFFQGLTFKEISEILQIPVRSLQYKLRNALTELEFKLKKEGL